MGCTDSTIGRDLHAAQEPVKQLDKKTDIAVLLLNTSRLSYLEPFRIFSVNIVFMMKCFSLFLIKIILTTECFEAFENVYQ